MARCLRIRKRTFFRRSTSAASGALVAAITDSWLLFLRISYHGDFISRSQPLKRVLELGRDLYFNLGEVDRLLDVRNRTRHRTTLAFSAHRPDIDAILYPR